MLQVVYRVFNKITLGHAERQAVNSTIQGSAADIAKRAMVLVEQRLSQKLSPSPRKTYNPCTWVKGRGEGTEERAASLVLQLHDELLYEEDGKGEDTKKSDDEAEVCRESKPRKKIGGADNKCVSDKHVMEAVRIIKSGMEEAVNLSVKLPVKVKTGNSWGALREITL
ncbi:unnamed protein product [Timema podura]|uniref:DNA-directed DNA polymerase family A palm domain-containing protein n=1 Tax=Timema podura TaxID=61482 RepID=A0ABN7P106_TIMPD|nr:unnamed protein product [Timema podura]